MSFGETRPFRVGAMGLVLLFGGKRMEKFVPYEKLSKKEKRRMDALRRGTWQGVNPVTRKSENPKAYNRSKARQLDMEQCRA